MKYHRPNSRSSTVSTVSNCEEFHTAPNSPEPAKSADSICCPPQFSTSSNFNFCLPNNNHQHNGLFHPNQPPARQMKVANQFHPPVYPRGIDNSFSTISSSLDRSSTFDHSFATETTEITIPNDTQSTHADSVVGLFDDGSIDFEWTNPQFTQPTSIPTLQDVFVQELLTHGPFTLHNPFPGKLPLRYRYEFERLGRSWGIPLQLIYRGDVASWRSHDDFWAWAHKHSQRGDRAMPEKTPRRAWENAQLNFQTDTPSEVVVLTGELNWCDPKEKGILDLKLNPLKTEKTCRFHRRFGSDRFLTLTIPAPSRHPLFGKKEEATTAFREAIARWLTRNDHYCLGRTWRPFYVEEVKTKHKVKSEPRFRVEFFAIDGLDFIHPIDRPIVAPPNQKSDNHTAMHVGDLLEWHMPGEANSRQSNCKLFQRLSLGLSKTLASVVLRPTQIVRLRDHPNWKMVMNDGCALMSRPLAQQICNSIGITGPTPSCFQARIAGAKGLWMVDRHYSSIRSFSGGDDVWLQISDSQLKIYPHPQDFSEEFDPEKLTFEVVNWAKPLHPVELNIQLLAILNHGGDMKQRLAKLTKDGIDELYDDMVKVLQSDSPVLCRSLLQKLRPPGDDGENRLRRLEQWVMNDAEFIIRLSEAGFAPQSFWPLRKRLAQLMNGLLERHVEELKIEVPLSTYAYCIADPYDILAPDEVHFGFSARWNDPSRNFEDSQVEGMEVLVGRVPAHVPSDIQRRKAVWKPELRHFQDVIVFPRTGNIALAHMLSGGDYDGDTPWICWDQEIVQNFKNSDLPVTEFTANHFGLTSHSLPMSEVKTTDDFLQSTFDFNLTTSTLGICTVEHEKIAYDESISSSKAIELASLLSHLVDGRKGGVQLSESAWKAYRKRVSPKERQMPAYRNRGRKPKSTNIVDYLKFNVAQGHAHLIREKLEREFPEDQGSSNVDEDLARPSKQAWEAVCSDRGNSSGLRANLQEVQSAIDELCEQWKRAFRNEPKSFPPEARQAIESAEYLQPPSSGTHPLLHTWQNSPHEWRRLLASCAYVKHRHSSFIFHAFGETLCQLKAEAFSSRTVVQDILACYRMNQKMVAKITEPGQLSEEEDADHYEGEEAIEAFLLGNDKDVYDDGSEDYRMYY